MNNLAHRNLHAYVETTALSRHVKLSAPKRSSLICRQRASTVRPLASMSVSTTTQPTGLLLEVDGAVMDIHSDGHRVAFNNAFHSIGMDCVSWSPPIYNDLLGRSDGTGEGLVRAYYTTVGWPLMIPTAERDAFVRKVHELKDKELVKLLQRDGLPLRQDVKQVISDAVASGAVVSLLCGTQCTLPELLAASCVRLLGPELAPAVRVFTFALAPPEEGAEGGEGEGGVTTLSQMLSAAAGDLKQRAAMQLVYSIQQQSAAKAAKGEESSPQPVGLAVDPSLMAVGGSQQRVTPEFVAALATTTGVPAANTIAVAASNSVLQAAAGAGLLPIAVPRKFATQGSFPSARAKFDGFGPGLATWPRLKSLLASAQSNGQGIAGK